MSTKTRQTGYYERMRQGERDALDRDRRAAMGKLAFAPLKTVASTTPVKARPWWQTIDWKTASPPMVNMALISLVVSLQADIQKEKGSTARYFRFKRLQSRVKAQIKK